MLKYSDCGILLVQRSRHKYLIYISRKEGLNEEKDRLARQELQALSSSIKNLLAQWFAVGLLDLRQVTWESPGSILEKVFIGKQHVIHTFNTITKSTGVSLFLRSHLIILSQKFG